MIDFAEGLKSWLGDIVVSVGSGVVQYDNGTLAAGKLEIRDTSQAPSAALVGKVKSLLPGRAS